ncbi:NAD(P)/FAD-dependent oxidoreductase [Gammaproteobacteria bacterium]|nr:NAD(P)/FAD-dependent oxidoreductase [Gammaproteobacteria bacterium]
MKTENYSCESVIVGGGIIGLAIAAELSKQGREVIVLESENQTIQHASSHNSEVIHSGIYYETNSLKAKLCVEGNKLLYKYCKDNEINHKRLGKLIFANTDNELDTLNKLHANAYKNGIEKISILDKKQLISLEPNLIAQKGLFIESTGILDSHSFAVSLEAEIESYGNPIVTSSPVIDGRYHRGKWILQIKGNPSYSLTSDLVINAAGFNSINLAKKFGVLGLPKSIYVKGHYYKYNGKNPFNHLIYPVPEEQGLGVHTSTDMSNILRFGPDAEIIDSPNYIFDNSEKRAQVFINSIDKYFKDFNSELLVEDFCGVRVRLGETHNTSDFSIKFPESHGYDGLINLAGIESPGLTSSLAIAKYVAQRL